MTLNEFFAAAERYANLGGAVQRQLQKVVDEGPDVYTLEDINPNALSIIKDFLGLMGELYEDEEIGADAFSVLVSIDEAEDELKNLNAPPKFEP